MSVISIPSNQTPLETELEHLGVLANNLSGELGRVHDDDLDLTIADALNRIGTASMVDDCRLIEFDESGAVVRVHVAASLGSQSPAEQSTSGSDDWLIRRLSRGEMVAISRAEDMPVEATASRAFGRRKGACSILGVPVSGKPRCALVMENAKMPRLWAEPIVERLRSVTELLSTALLRRIEPSVLHSDVAAMARLNARLRADNLYLKEEIKSTHDCEEIVGESPLLRVALSRLAQVAPMNSSVLLLGPTGSGKELFARALHDRSRRHARPLVRVNCAALPPTLVESELFGHEKGAFTGAVGTRQGRFELADGGTIFLDEIGDLAPEVQVKFLRVLQEGEFERVGSSRTRRVDVRVIAATHHDLDAAVADGRFRADLYYRLSVYPIVLPSLQERSEDIPHMAWFFINRHQRELGRRITEIPPHVLDALQRHTWPGNVRELENVIVRAMIASPGHVLQLDAPLTMNLAKSRPAVQPDSLEDMQRAHIEGVLQRCSWKINGPGNAADRLGIHPNTLRFRLKKLGLSRPV